jgi:type IV pilus assembly protein PilO
MRFGLRETIFLLLLLALPVAAYMFSFEKLITKTAALDRDTMQREEKLKQLETATRYIDDLGVEIDRLTTAITDFQQRLPEQQELEVILKQVWETATKHRLAQRSVRTSKTTQTQYYTESPIAMVIVGDFDGYYSFLLDLENLPRITRVPKMKLKKVGGMSDGEIQADMTLNIFFDNEQSTKGGAL